ncbi:MAG: hypothetical protein COW25_01920 [Candidatus Nealsonbacteria bacterium CG15_BIG_FIL_POST_REV_8_21_14_020_37_12]|uniref:Uncharacterized protein n=2 Tax=Candidatus Nealsoniibacteriota TaxID=1817911 RepID=A0A2M7Z3W3_9BACT|nr:MAG: hypothetical protein COW25_01920 [Candidatus Nealsonbacteria bacterium CG15_BIG_FIL_POST_REV_8_21_14_020_37_12]PJA83826.1 MAG: hypothetical protein CO146_00445 [Candidatus Nealsonbacteria bacterium CG_4_9_14_3_um_filter_37_29]
MTVEIADVKRVNGKAVRLAALIGDIKSCWIRWPETGEPYEESRMRYGVQILDQDTLHISDADYQELKNKVRKIFSEDRSKPKPRSRKETPTGVQGKLL